MLQPDLTFALPFFLAIFFFSCKKEKKNALHVPSADLAVCLSLAQEFRARCIPPRPKALPDGPQ